MLVADITPNQFVIELSSRRKIHSQDEVLEVMDVIPMGPEHGEYQLLPAVLRGTEYPPVLGEPQRTGPPDGHPVTSAHPQGDAQGGHHLSALGMASPPYSW